jgi:hypothetical protein
MFTCFSGRERLARVGDLVTVVEVFDGLFEADGDEQADDDGGDVDEEVALGGGGVVGWVDVEHGGGLLIGRLWIGRDFELVGHRL